MRRFVFQILFLLAFCESSFGAGSHKGAPRRETQRIVSDFDGDRHADVAVTSVSGRTYQVKIRLSAKPIRVSLYASVLKQPGLRLRAVDVDHDNDLDLVLTGVVGYRPV